MMNRLPKVLQFNKANGEFTTALDPVNVELLNRDFHNYTDVVNIDLDNEVVVGTWDDWNIQPIQDRPVRVTEADINSLAEQRILADYPLTRQLNIIGSVLETVAEEYGVECEELKAMNDFVSEVRRANALRRQFFIESPEYEYLTTQEVQEELRRKYEGIDDTVDTQLLGQ